MELIYIIALGITIVLIFIIWYISMVNKLNRAIVKIEEADSGIDVALEKRYSVLTKMIEVVKSYAKHEKETLFEVVSLRKNMSTIEKNEANSKMNDNLSKIQVLAENYPELRSSDNYKTLQSAIADIEEHLQASRRLYNSNVSIYNQMIVSFPISLIARKNNMQKKDFFEIENEGRKDVKIDL